jgi:hypothetical protein
MENENYTYFKAHLDELIERYDGRFIVIKGTEVIDDYGSFDEAYNETVKSEALGTFLIQQCVKPENDTAHFAWHNIAFSQVVQV